MSGCWLEMQALVMRRNDTEKVCTVGHGQRLQSIVHFDGR